MKKHDECYVLPFVLVVTVVLCIVAVAILSSALDNLTAQQDSIDRMQDKYAAQGEIEKVVAQLQKGTIIENLTDIEDTTKVTANGGKYDIEAVCGNVKIECTVSINGNVVTYSSYTVTTEEPTGEEDAT